MTVDVCASPLQLRHLAFSKISVEMIDGYEAAKELWAPRFDFEDVLLNTEVKVAIRDGQADDPRDFMVTVKLSTAVPDGEGRRAPYDLYVVAEGWFEIADVVPVEQRESFIEVNGASLVVGAIRDMVLQVTSRSGYGALTLPTLRFVPISEA